MVNGKRYPAGSYVVMTAQAFRPHVLDMFEPQYYPARAAYPGGPPEPPYENAGWTLAFQMGVRFDRVLDGFSGPFEKVTEARPPHGRVIDSPAAAGYLVSHHQNDAFIAVNRLLAAGERVYWPRDRTLSDSGAGTGAMYVAAGPATKTILERAAEELEPAVDAFFDNSPVFRLPTAARSGVRRVAWFDTREPLRSGWARGQERLEGGVAVVDAPLGKGRVLPFGPRINYRAQSHGTFKFLFNAIYYGAASGR